MLKDTSELKEFILWAKDKALLKAFKIGNVEVTFSDLAFVDAISQITPETDVKSKTEERNTSKTLVDTLNTDEEDEELLTWSSRP